MRLVTWNCCRGPFARKVPLLDAFAPDIAVVQECAKPLIESPDCLWFGDNPRQGIAVRATPPYSLRRMKVRREVPKFIIPVAVLGPTPFTLFAVWTLGTRPHPYVEAAVRAVDLYRHRIAGSPTVLAGDFNSNTLWDADHREDRSHSALVRRLADLGVVSAYHAARNEAHGAETEPTYYFQWKKERPFHIDYCFLPRAWAQRISRVEIGAFDDWRAFSDHRPLLVDIADDPGERDVRPPSTPRRSRNTPRGPLLTETESIADSIVLRSIDCRLALAEIYAKVRFDEAR